MIKNFNFYDIYGYFLPGLVLLTLFTVPTILLEPRWPTSEIASAIAFLALAYVAGHILQTVAAAGIPSYRISRIGSERVFRFPSEIFLDSRDATFTPEFKIQLANKMMTLFGIDIGVDELTDDSTKDHVKAVGKRRQEAFFVCRSALVAKKQNIYGEQFEGMYTLMRGLTAAFAFGAAYYLGWGLATQFPGVETYALQWAGTMMILATIVSAASLFPGDRSDMGKVAGYFVLAFLYLGTIPIGAIVAFEYPSAQSISGLMWIVFLGSSLAAIRSYNSFRTFTGEFAKAIFRDFFVYDKSALAGAAEQSPE